MADAVMPGFGAMKRAGVLHAVPRVTRPTEMLIVCSSNESLRLPCERPNSPEFSVSHSQSPRTGPACFFPALETAGVLEWNWYALPAMDTEGAEWQM